MRAADAGWIGLAAAVLGYEAAAASREDWELLSEAADRYRRAHPIITHVAVIYLAGHLLRLWPQPFDPLHQLAARMSQR